MEVGVKNDEEVSALMNSKFKDATIERATKEVLPNINKEELAEIVELTKRKELLEANGGEVAKAELPQVNNRIKEITNAVQERSAEEVDVQKPTEDSAEVGVRDTAREVAGEAAPEEVETAEVPKEEVAEPVEEQEVALEEPERPETKRVKITEPFTVGRSRVTFNEDGSIKTVVNVKTGKEVTLGTRSKVEKIILEKVIDVDAGKKAPQVEGITEADIAGYIAENSENVREVAEAIRIEKQRIKDAEQRADKIKTQDLGKEALADTAFTRESWESVTGNPPSENISNYWIRSKEKGGRNLKDGAKGFEADEIVKFIFDYPNAEALKVLRGEPLDRNDLIDLENKFKQLTGTNPTESNLQTVIDIETGS